MPWYRGDCHVHTDRSVAGELTPEQVASAAREFGLDFIAITEHNTADTHGAFAGAGPLVIPGQEMTTTTGHWLALGLPPGSVVDRAAGRPVSVRLSVEGVPEGTARLHTERGSFPAPDPCFSTTASEAGFVRAEVRHPDGRMAALTNPIMLV